MKKLTLHFLSLSDLSLFSKELPGGYLLNTINMTLTGKIPAPQVSRALQLHNAVVVETTEQIYSYKWIQ